MKIPVVKQPRKSLLPNKMNTTATSPIQRAKIDQLQYELPRLFIRKELDERGVKPQTDIWIYPDYPYGFTAVVGAHGRFVYIFEVHRGEIVSCVQKLCLGVRPNGALMY